MASEEHYTVFYEYFSEQAVESMFDELPQETLDELLQVITLVDKKMVNYKQRIKDLEARLR